MWLGRLQILVWRRKGLLAGRTPHIRREGRPAIEHPNCSERRTRTILTKSIFGQPDAFCMSSYSERNHLGQILQLQTLNDPRDSRVRGFVYLKKWLFRRVR